MPGFLSVDEIIETLTVDEDVLQQTFYKVSTAVEAANVWHSLWRDGQVPSAGGDGAAGSGTPGSGGTALTNADGGLAKGWADQSPATKHLLAWDARANVAGTLVLLDRLVSVSGISLVGTGTKNVGSAALPRYTTGDLVRAFLEVTTVTATSAVVGTASYTDQGGTNGQTSPSFTFPAAATNVGTIIPIGLASGDWGMRSVETLNITTASTGSAACNLFLAKELGRIVLEANLGNVRDFVSQVKLLPRVYDGATLMLAWIASATTAPTVDGTIYAGYR